MPAYGTQGPFGLTSVQSGDVKPTVLFNAEIPAAGLAGVASVAVALAPIVGGGAKQVSVQFECPGGIGAGVFQIQDADIDAAANYDSIPFGGSNPGQVAAANMNASGVARVELSVLGNFLRVLCVTQPGAAITVRVNAH
jgi:hypothetical protein